MHPARMRAKADQRRDALARANQVRIARAELKRRIASGDVSASEAILFRRWDTDTMPVGDLLTSQRHWGDKRCHRLLTPMRLLESKRIGSMTDRQRVDLAGRLNGFA